jgi:hypothetical protein
MEAILMDDPDPQSLSRKLDDFSKRLDARSRDMAQRGEFSDVGQSLLDRIQERRDRLQTKIQSAEKSGANGKLIMLELERDFRAVFDDWELMVEKRDADEMKSR